MTFSLDSPLFKGNNLMIKSSYSKLSPEIFLPYEFSGCKSEFLACRESAWLGASLNRITIYEVTDRDSAKFLTSICVNKDFSLMTPGMSKHAIICNEKGQMVTDGVIMRLENSYRAYAMAPVLQYFTETSSLDVQGKYVTDEFFFQVDGPKSLEILEKACQCDLHDIKFAKNKKVKIRGTDIAVHRLGMSGALAYEVHGNEKDADTVYALILKALEEYGGKRLGTKPFGMINHTPGGYPNGRLHYEYALKVSGKGLADFAKNNCTVTNFAGSAADNPEAFYMTPYDVGWGYLVNFEHEFTGKEALQKAKQEKRKKAVTLEWNTEDVGDVFMSQFRGRDVEPYDSIEPYSHLCDTGLIGTTRGDYVLADGKKIGIASGRAYAFYERRMISLAFIDTEYAVEGKDLVVLWGTLGKPMKEIRAKVARFPYFNEEYRNETFDVEKIPRTP
jgi:glycine cleavage system aminomethyltransferase T